MVFCFLNWTWRQQKISWSIGHYSGCFCGGKYEMVLCIPSFKRIHLLLVLYYRAINLCVFTTQWRKEEKWELIKANCRNKSLCTRRKAPSVCWPLCSWHMSILKHPEIQNRNTYFLSFDIKIKAKPSSVLSVFLSFIFVSDPFINSYTVSQFCA